MCVSPNLLRDGQLVACRRCGQCRDNKIDDWVGRCIAESKTSKGATSLTLTYGRDEMGNASHTRTALLTYSDVQKYFKQIRVRGYPCRYLVVGEIGSENGRTHWHGIVFWQKTTPTSMLDYGRNSWHREPREFPVQVPIEWDKRFNEPCWTHGFSHWSQVARGHEKGSIRYACKYIGKDVGSDSAAQSKYAMSKNPPLGADYFIARAQKFVDEGISPQNPFYTFPMEARRKNGKIVQFRLAGKTGDIFCQAFIDKWKEQRGTHYPSSDYLMEYEDKITRTEWDRETEFAPKLQVLDRRWPMAPPFGFTDSDIQFDAYSWSPYVETNAGKLFYGVTKEGIRAWRNEAPAALSGNAGTSAQISPKQRLGDHPQSILSDQNPHETMRLHWIDGQNWPEVWTE